MNILNYSREATRLRKGTRPINFIYSAANDRPAESIADAKAFLTRCHARRVAKQSSYAKVQAILEVAASHAVAMPRARSARKQETVDVIAMEPNGHGIGWAGFSCEIGFARTEFRNHLTLVQFARQHFGSGILRKIATNRYAVLIRKKQAPVAWSDEFDRPRAA